MAAIIVAVDENNGIGFNGELLEHIPEDMKRFQKLTIEGGSVIMGRKTYDSLPKKPLPNRRNYVITRNPDKFINTDMAQYISMEEAIQLIKITTDTFMDDALKFYVIGGEQIYKKLLPYCREIYMTVILKTHDKVDSYFPKLSPKEWSGEMTYQGIYQNISYQFWHFNRI